MRMTRLPNPRSGKKLSTKSLGLGMTTASTSKSARARQERKRKQIAERGRQDFWFFLISILRNPILYPPLHKPLANWLMPDAWKKRKKLLLLPRGHVKSNLITVGYSLWQIVKNRNIRLLLYSHKDDDSAKFATGIANIIENDKFFHYIYPEIRPAMNRGRKAKWTSSGGKWLVDRPRKGYIEATIETAASGVSIVGRHYDLLVSDDMVTNKNITADAIKKTQADHELMESLLDPGAQELCIGTRYDYSDEYGRILDTPALQDEWDCKVIPAVNEDGVFQQFLGGREWIREDDFLYLIFPSRFTLDKRDYRHPTDEHQHRKSLVATYNTQGAGHYANQYGLLPFDPAAAEFKLKDIIRIDSLPVLRDDQSYMTFRVLDMSSDEPGTDSYTALVTGKIGPRCDIYITDIWWGQFDGIAVGMELIKGQAMYYELPGDKRVERDKEDIPTSVGHEKGPYERALKPWLEEASRKANVFVPMMPLPGAAGQKNKDERIRGLKAWVQGGKFHIMNDCRNAEILIEELTRFPKFRRNDCADATAQIPVLMLPGDASAYLAEDATSRPDPKDEGRVGGNAGTFDEALEELIGASKNYIGADRVNSDAGPVLTWGG